MGGQWAAGATPSTWSCTGKVSGWVLGLLCGLVSSSWRWKALSGPTSLLQHRCPTDESLHPLVPHFPRYGEGQQPVGIPIGKELRKGLVILTWNNAGHPPELPVWTRRRQPPLPPALGTSLPCKQIVLLRSGGSCTSGRLIWERHQL